MQLQLEIIWQYLCPWCWERMDITWYYSGYQWRHHFYKLFWRHDSNSEHLCHHAILWIYSFRHNHDSFDGNHNSFLLNSDIRIDYIYGCQLLEEKLSRRGLCSKMGSSWKISHKIQWSFRFEYFYKPYWVKLHPNCNNKRIQMRSDYQLQIIL